MANANLGATGSVNCEEDGRDDEWVASCHRVFCCGRGLRKMKSRSLNFARNHLPAFPGRRVRSEKGTLRLPFHPSRSIQNMNFPSICVSFAEKKEGFHACAGEAATDVARGRVPTDDGAGDGGSEVRPTLLGRDDDSALEKRKDAEAHEKKVTHVSLPLHNPAHRPPPLPLPRCHLTTSVEPIPLTTSRK